MSAVAASCSLKARHQIELAARTEQQRRSKQEQLYLLSFFPLKLGPQSTGRTLMSLSLKLKANVMSETGGAVQPAPTLTNFVTQSMAVDW